MFSKKKMKNMRGESEERVFDYLKESQKVIEQKEEEVNIEIPQQAEFFKTPVRFGNIPVDKLPLGCDEKEQYRKIYPKISLPFQIVERISFGHKDLEPNQLFFGDNLHIMRALPSNSIDLIYIDPPFFSGRNYNIVFGDQNEVRSFVDIWEGGMPGYLTWLNARILEMKRLLKPTGSIYVHCDWHASHYIKCELDKIFGYDKFINEIVWTYSGAGTPKNRFAKRHDIIFWYSKGKDWKFNIDKVREEYAPATIERFKHYIGNKRNGGDFGIQTLNPLGKHPDDVLRISIIPPSGNERIGYPTQKPIELIQKLVEAASEPGDTVADFFMGGGTTIAVAAGVRAKRTKTTIEYYRTEPRRFIGSDISKIAVSVTRDRLLRAALGGNKKEIQQSLGRVPDISIVHWGVYEVPELVRMNEKTFRNFIISAYNGRLASSEGLVHGYKQSVPIFVGSPSQNEPLTEKEVIEFAKHIVKTKGHHQGIMISWGFTLGARSAAQQLESQHAVAIDFVKIQLIPIESHEFKEHIISKHPEYRNLLKFILPPEVRISRKGISSLEYEFDVSESVSLNPTGKIINVQWDFSYNGERFISTPGYSFLGMKNNKPVLKVSYKFTSSGKKKIACKVQDDEGGEKIEVMEIEVK